MLEEAFLAAFSGVIDNDNFNRLIVSAGLTARETSVLRAYARYLRQAGIPYSLDYIATTLDKYPVIAAMIFRLFYDALDPKISEKVRIKKAAEHHQRIEAALSDVPSLDDDRILRRYVNVVDATLRTNYFQRNADGSPKAMLAFKLDPHLVDGLLNRDHSARCSSTASKSKVSICASARWRVAACVGRTVPKITGPKYSAW